MQSHRLCEVVKIGYGLRTIVGGSGPNDFGCTMNFADVFKTARPRLGLSQPKAARKWNVPLKALQNWEQGVRTPHAETLLRLFPVLFPHGFSASKLTEQKKVRHSARPRARPRARTRR